jgi:putative DNA primase/helicase
MISAADIHARIAWPIVLAQLGVPEEFRREKVGRREKHGACPGCGGHDRYFFDNKHGRGDYYCRGCGPGDGFKLLQFVHGWTFAETRKRVMEAAGLAESTFKPIAVPTPRARATEAIAEPSERVRRLRRERCAIENCDDAVDYLASRHLWPLPEGCTLSAHASVEYWSDGQRIGRYASLVADVVDVAGELVTAHVTYLQGGKKLAGYEPRKILGGLYGRVGAVVRLMPAESVLGVAEGLETALSAALLDSLPVWAAINTSLLAKFEPPVQVERLVIYADRDEAGLNAALKLMERLQGRVRLEVRTPVAPANDWNDVLITKGQ